jgi:PPOX class probable F420-dependent enzyme
MMTVAVSIPDRLKDLLKPETRAFAHLALVRGDGTPHVTPIWFDYDGQNFIFNTARGRVKDRIMHRHPVVSFAISDPADPYRYIQVTGPVVSETEEGAREQINKLHQKYRGNPNYPVRQGEVRVTYKVQPQHISPKQ